MLQDPNNIEFTLPEPVPYLGINLSKGFWYCIYLNNTAAKIYFGLVDDNGITQYTGNWNVPSDVVAQWGTSNQVVTDAFIAAKGWQKQG